MVTDATFRPYMRVIQRRLHRYRLHPDWEDLLSTVYVEDPIAGRRPSLVAGDSGSMLSLKISGTRSRRSHDPP
jgi:hypothetical protein